MTVDNEVLDCDSNLNVHILSQSISSQRIPSCSVQEGTLDKSPVRPGDENWERLAYVICTWLGRMTPASATVSDLSLETTSLYLGLLWHAVTWEALPSRLVAREVGALNTANRHLNVSAWRQQRGNGRTLHILHSIQQYKVKRNTFLQKQSTLYIHLHKKQKYCSTTCPLLILIR